MQPSLGMRGRAVPRVPKGNIYNLLSCLGTGYEPHLYSTDQASVLKGEISSLQFLYAAL